MGEWRNTRTGNQLSLPDELLNSLSKLGKSDLQGLELVATSLTQDVVVHVNDGSDFLTKDTANQFGFLLRLHHAMSGENFKKDKLEFALERVLRRSFDRVELTPPTHRGYDLIVGGAKWSLKTQADSSIKEDRIWISKYKELGTSRWEDESDLARMRDEFVADVTALHKILTFRCLSAARSYSGRGYRYELVEIPIELLTRVRHSETEMRHNSKQSPKPGYSRVYETDGQEMFRLYFDGGSERKLQIQNLQKSACIVHATWTLGSDVE